MSPLLQLLRNSKTVQIPIVFKCSPIMLRRESLAKGFENSSGLRTLQTTRVPRYRNFTGLCTVPGTGTGTVPETVPQKYLLWQPAANYYYPYECANTFCSPRAGLLGAPVLLGIPANWRIGRANFSTALGWEPEAYVQIPEKVHRALEVAGSRSSARYDLVRISGRAGH